MMEDEGNPVVADINQGTREKKKGQTQNCFGTGE